MLWDYDIDLVSFISLMLINGVANVALVQYCGAKDLLLMLELVMLHILFVHVHVFAIQKTPR
jgi:hypothetical protein